MVNSSRAQRNTSRRQPYAWLGAGALGVGLALAGAGTAHADDGVNETASTAAASSARASGNSAAGAAAKSTPRSPAATSRSAGPRQSVNDGAGKRAPTAANRSTLAATPRARSAVPVSAASASAGKPSASERAAQVAAPATPVQEPPTASATAAVLSEAGDRPLRRPVERPVAAPAPVAARAAVNPAEAINAAVVDWFDSTSAWLATLPRGPLNELASGALLLVRRSLFNQQPTADPYQFSIKASGQLVGTLGVVDAEGDALTFALSKAPELGTVQIAPDGIWTYTPGPDFAYGVPESFSVTVNGGGFNILNPSVAPLKVTVPLGLASFDYQRYIQNVTTRPVGYTKLSSEAYRQPPKGYQIQPGEQVEINFSTRTSYVGTIKDSVGLSTGADTWKINYTYQGGWSSVCGDSGGNAGCAKSKSDTDRTLIGDSAGVYTYQPDSPGAADALAKLSQMADQNVDGLTVQWLKANFKDIPADDQGWVVKSSSADNPSDNTNSRSYAVTDSTSTTEGSSWKVGGGIKWSPIEKVLELAVNGEYGRSYSSTTGKTFTTTFTQSIPPWSANELLQQPPKLLATGDAVFTFAGLGVTYRFFNMDFLLPSQTKETPFYEFRTEPLQPKNPDGTPKANIGFTLKDPKSELIEPEYTVGTQRQLSLKAYNGIATSQASFEQRSVWTSSDDTVVSVNSSGKLTANAPGTATITARYDWTIPLGGGNTREDHVLATMKVTVVE